MLYFFQDSKILGDCYRHDYLCFTLLNISLLFLYSFMFFIILIYSALLHVCIPFMHVCIHACSVAQSCPVLCNPSCLSIFSVYGIFQARILKLVVIPSSRGFFLLRDRTRIWCIPCISRQIHYLCAPWKALKNPSASAGDSGSIPDPGRSHKP